MVSNIYVGTDGKLHKVQGGADSVLPFSGKTVKTVFVGANGNTSAWVGAYTFPQNCTASVYCVAYAKDAAGDTSYAELNVAGHSAGTGEWTNTQVKTMGLKNIQVTAGQGVSVYGVSRSNKYWMMYCLAITMVIE